jgi:hypothetical protein
LRVVLFRSPARWKTTRKRGLLVRLQAYEIRVVQFHSVHAFSGP